MMVGVRGSEGCVWLLEEIIDRSDGVADGETTGVKPLEFRYD